MADKTLIGLLGRGLSASKRTEIPPSKRERLKWRSDPRLSAATRAERAVVGPYELIAFELPPTDAIPARTFGWEIFGGPTHRNRLLSGETANFRQARLAAAAAALRLTSLSIDAATSESAPKAPLIDVEVEAYSDGTDRRAHARGWAREIRQGIFVVIPFYLREICGPAVRWHAPARGMPILTVEPAISLSEANDVLKCWAMRTFAENA